MSKKYTFMDAELLPAEMLEQAAIELKTKCSYCKEYFCDYSAVSCMIPSCPQNKDEANKVLDLVNAQ